jgi:hypothetical protein
MKYKVGDILVAKYNLQIQNDDRSYDRCTPGNHYIVLEIKNHSHLQSYKILGQKSRNTSTWCISAGEMSLHFTVNSHNVARKD